MSTPPDGEAFPANGGLVPQGADADWYPDPEVRDQLRYWDGTAWTEHRAPAVTGLSTIGDWFGAAFGAVGRCWKDVAVLFFLLILPFAILLPILFVNAFDGIAVEGLTGLETTSVLGQPQIDFSGVDGDDLAIVGFNFAKFIPAVLLLLASLVAGVVHGNAIRHRLFWAHRDVDTSWKRSLVAGFKRVPLKLLMGFVYVVAVTLLVMVFMIPVVLAAVTEQVGLTILVALVMFVLFLVVGVFLWVRLSMVFTNVAVGRSNPLSTSWKITKSSLWPLLGRLCLWVALTTGVGFMFSFLNQGVFALVDFQDLDGVDRLEFSEFFGGSTFAFALVVLYLIRGVVGAATGAFTAGAEGVLYHQLDGPVKDTA